MDREVTDSVEGVFKRLLHAQQGECDDNIEHGDEVARDATNGVLRRDPLPSIATGRQWHDRPFIVDDASLCRRLPCPEAVPQK